MKRLTSWPERLAEAVEVGQSRTFGDDYFCATFAADCILAMTGTDPMEGYRGLAQEEAAAEIGMSFDAYLRKLFGEPVHISRARRGDVVFRENPGGLAVGICLGSISAFASGDGGLSFLPTLEQLAAYRVG